PASGGIDSCVTDLSGCIGCAVIQLSVENQSAANSGSDCQTHDISSALGCAAPPFTQCRAIRIVVECRRKLHATSHFIAQRKITPPEIWSDDDDPACAI